jgi:hypothetical protein
LDGKSDGKSDGTVLAIAVDKNAPSSRTYLAHPARAAVVGQAKNRSPVYRLTRFRTRPHEMFRLGFIRRVKRRVFELCSGNSIMEELLIAIELRE